jgi:hypothetical protein
MHTTFFFVLLVYYVYNYMFLHFFKMWVLSHWTRKALERDCGALKRACWVNGRVVLERVVGEQEKRWRRNFFFRWVASRRRGDEETSSDESRVGEEVTKTSFADEVLELLLGLSDPAGSASAVERRVVEG